MYMKMICGACGEVGLRAICSRVTVEYEGNAGSIVELSHSCDECGALLFDESDVRENKRSWNKFRKQFDLIPLGCEIRVMRERAGLTQLQAAKIFGGGPVAFSKYECDDLIPDGAMVNLLRLAIAFPETIAKLVWIKGQHVRIDTLVSAFDSADSFTWEQDKLEVASDFDPTKLKPVSTTSLRVETQAQEAVWL
jgi:HTH-type transcriptional regulator/antitoxin MqsA